jgi:hypothetical protein
MFPVIQHSIDAHRRRFGTGVSPATFGSIRQGYDGLGGENVTWTSAAG